MCRMARLLRAMPELMILIKGLVSATRSVFFTLLMLCGLVYVFAILFTQLCIETKVGEVYFSDVTHSAYTLLIYGALMDSIGAPLEALGAESYILATFYLIFVLLATITVMNMLIGVLCEVVTTVAAVERETLTVMFVKGRLEKVIQMIDEDGNGNVSKEEFAKILDDKSVVEALNEVGVDVEALVESSDILFVDEETGEEKELSMLEFMKQVLQFRGNNGATVKDIVDLHKFIKKKVDQTSTDMEELRKMLEKGFNVTRHSLGGMSCMGSVLHKRSSCKSENAEWRSEDVAKLACSELLGKLKETSVIGSVFMPDKVEEVHASPVSPPKPPLEAQLEGSLGEESPAPATKGEPLPLSSWAPSPQGSARASGGPPLDPAPLLPAAAERLGSSPGIAPEEVGPQHAHRREGRLSTLQRAALHSAAELIQASGPPPLPSMSGLAQASPEEWHVPLPTMWAKAMPPLSAGLGLEVLASHSPPAPEAHPAACAEAPAVPPPLPVARRLFESSMRSHQVLPGGDTGEVVALSAAQRRLPPLKRNLSEDSLVEAAEAQPSGGTGEAAAPPPTQEGWGSLPPHDKGFLDRALRAQAQPSGGTGEASQWAQAPMPPLEFDASAGDPRAEALSYAELFLRSGGELHSASPPLTWPTSGGCARA